MKTVLFLAFWCAFCSLSFSCEERCLKIEIKRLDPARELGGTIRAEVRYMNMCDHVLLLDARYASPFGSMRFVDDWPDADFINYFQQTDSAHAVTAVLRLPPKSEIVYELDVAAQVYLVGGINRVVEVYLPLFRPTPGVYQKFTVSNVLIIEGPYPGTMENSPWGIESRQVDVDVQAGECR